MQHTTWCFDVKQSNGEEVRERVTFNAGANLEIPNSRGTADFLVRWEGSKHHSSISVTKVKGLTALKYTSDDNEKYVPVVGFECRGVEPWNWHSGNTGVSVLSRGGHYFRNVDLSEDWCDYDVEKNEAVSVCNVVGELRVHHVKK